MDAIVDLSKVYLPAMGGGSTFKEEGCRCSPRERERESIIVASSGRCIHIPSASGHGPEVSPNTIHSFRSSMSGASRDVC